jgi:hypothetical protein
MSHTLSPRRNACIAVLLAGSVGTCAISACDPRIVDVGANDVGVGLGPATTGSQYGCAEWIEEELLVLREGACAGACGMVGGAPYALGSKKELIAATAGQWLFCGGTSFGPQDAIGVEFAPGCRLYFLRYDPGGVIVRGTEASFQGRYGIHDPRPAGEPRRIDVETFEQPTTTFLVTADRCPERLELVTADRRVELAWGLPNATRPHPTR